MSPKTSSTYNCGVCGVECPRTHNRQKFCQPCAQARRREQNRLRSRRMVGDRECMDCSTNINHRHGQARRCEPCAEKRYLDKTAGQQLEAQVYPPALFA